MTLRGNELAERMHELGKKIHARHGILPVIDRETQPDQWNAWRQWRKEHGLPVAFMDRQGRWTVISEWPPENLPELEMEYRTGGKTEL